MKTQTQIPTPKPQIYESGQRLHCPTCGSEIEILNPCNGTSAGQVFRCCGRDMTPGIGRAVHMDSES
jgi:hypothetical protein